MKAIEVNIKITIPAEQVEKEKITVQKAYDEFINVLIAEMPSEIKMEAEAHEI